MYSLKCMVNDQVCHVRCSPSTRILNIEDSYLKGHAILKFVSRDQSYIIRFDKITMT